MPEHKRGKPRDAKAVERLAQAKARLLKRREKRKKPAVKKNVPKSCRKQGSECENANTDYAQFVVDSFTAGLYPQLIAAFPNTATIIIKDASGTIPFAGTYVGKSGLGTLLLERLAPVSTPINVPPTSGTRGETFHSCNFQKIMVQANLALIFNCPGGEPTVTLTDATPAYFIFSFDSHCNLLQVEIFFNEASLIEFFSTTCIS